MRGIVVGKSAHGGPTDARGFRPGCGICELIHAPPPPQPQSHVTSRAYFASAACANEDCKNLWTPAAHRGGTVPLRVAICRTLTDHARVPRELATTLSKSTLLSARASQRGHALAAVRGKPS